jgi:hypothetical protein
LHPQFKEIVEPQIEIRAAGNFDRVICGSVPLVVPLRTPPATAVPVTPVVVQFSKLPPNSIPPRKCR